MKLARALAVSAIAAAALAVASGAQAFMSDPEIDISAIPAPAYRGHGPDPELTPPGQPVMMSSEEMAESAVQVAQVTPKGKKRRKAGVRPEAIRVGGMTGLNQERVINPAGVYDPMPEPALPTPPLDGFHFFPGVGFVVNQSAH